tara:strand:+ start:197 stop:352 length:156 start_codon:yes stop_codon:yes gene_type:complete
MIADIEQLLEIKVLHIVGLFKRRRRTESAFHMLFLDAVYAAAEKGDGRTKF